MKKLIGTLALILSTELVHAQGMQVFQNGSGGGGGDVTAAGDNDFTGTNTFLDTKFFILDDADNTKRFRFENSGITTGQTRIITIPNFDATMATLAGTESLSNKTLPSFELGSAATDTTITRSAAGRLAVEGIDAVLLTTTQEVSNKTFPTFELGTGATDTTFSRAAAGQAAVENNIIPVIAAAGSLTSTRVPFAGANNTISDDADLTFSTDTLSATKLSGSTLLTLGSGTGTGTIAAVICKTAPNQATTGTVEQVVGTCTIPANTLSADGDSLVTYITGVTAANGNNKQVRIRFGGLTGVLLYDSAAAASNNQYWSNFGFNSGIVRTSSTTIRSAISLARAAKGGTSSTTAMQYVEDAETVDYTIANDLVVTATTPTASGDFTLNTFAVTIIK